MNEYFIDITLCYVRLPILPILSSHFLTKLTDYCSIHNITYWKQESLVSFEHTTFFMQ